MIGMRLWIVAALAAVVLLLPVGAGAVPKPVLCGPGCGGGDGRPACTDFNLGSVWTAYNGNRFVCARNGSHDDWFPIF